MTVYEQFSVANIPKPCPFCGNQVNLDSQSLYDEDGSYIGYVVGYKCKCGCELNSNPNNIQFRSNEQWREDNLVMMKEVFNKWNRRV